MFLKDLNTQGQSYGQLITTTGGLYEKEHLLAASAMRETIMPYLASCRLHYKEKETVVTETSEKKRGQDEGTEKDVTQKLYSIDITKAEQAGNFIEGVALEDIDFTIFEKNDIWTSCSEIVCKYAYLCSCIVVALLYSMSNGGLEKKTEIFFPQECHALLLKYLKFGSKYSGSYDAFFKAIQEEYNFTFVSITLKSYTGDLQETTNVRKYVNDSIQSIFKPMSKTFQVLINEDMELVHVLGNYTGKINTISKRLQGFLKSINITIPAGIVGRDGDRLVAKTVYKTPAGTYDYGNIRGAYAPAFCENIVLPQLRDETDIKIMPLYDFFITTDTASGEDVLAEPALQVDESSASTILCYPLLVASMSYKLTIEKYNDKWVLGKALSYKEYVKWFTKQLRKWSATVLTTVTRRGLESKKEQVWGNFVALLSNYFILTSIEFKDSVMAKFHYTYYYNNRLGNLGVDTYDAFKEDLKSRCRTGKDWIGNSSSIIEKHSGLRIYDNKQYRYDVVLTANDNAFFGLTSFAYKEYAKRQAVGEEFGLSNILLGYNLASAPITVALDLQKKYSIYLNAGSRSGKGVEALNMLAGALAGGSPLVYLDNKPDMSRTLWQIELILNILAGNGQEYNADGTMNPRYKRILAIDGTAKVSAGTKCIVKENGQVYDMEASTSVRIDKAIAKAKKAMKGVWDDNYFVLAYLKLLQLVFLVANQPDIDIGGKARLVCVVDELRVLSDNLDNLFGTVSKDSTDEQNETDGTKEKKDKKVSKGIKYIKAEKLWDATGANALPEVVKKAVVLLNDMLRVWSIGKNASFTMLGKVSFIGIAQQLVGAVGTGGTMPQSKGVIGDMIDSMVYMVTGTGGIIAKNSRIDKSISIQDYAKDDPRIEKIKMIDMSEETKEGQNDDKESTRSFLLSEHESGLNQVVQDILIPLFVLNNNDLLTQKDKEAGRILYEKANLSTAPEEKELIECRVHETEIGQYVDSKKYMDNSSNTGGFLCAKCSSTDTAKGARERLCKEELLDVSDCCYLPIRYGDNSNNLIHSKVIKMQGLNGRVGFLGLLFQLFHKDGQTEQETAEKILEGLSKGYDIVWGIVQRFNLEGVECVEDYLYNMNYLYTEQALIQKYKGFTEVKKEEESPVQTIQTEETKVDFNNLFSTSGEQTQETKQGAETTPTPTSTPIPVPKPPERTGTAEPKIEVQNGPKPPPSMSEILNNREANPLNTVRPNNREASPLNTPRPNQNTLTPTEQQQGFANPNSSMNPQPVQQNTIIETVTPVYEGVIPEIETGVKGLRSVQNLSVILCKLMEQVYGSVSRIESIVVQVDGTMIINGLLFQPTFTQISNLPLDLQIKIQQGRLIDLFYFPHLYTYKSSEQEVGYKRSMFSKARYGFLSLRLLDIQCQDVAHVKLKSEIGMRNFQAIRRHIQMKLGTNMFTLKICGVDVDTPVDAVTGQQYEADYIEKCTERAGLFSRLRGLLADRGTARSSGGTPLLRGLGVESGSLASAIWYSRPMTIAKRAFGWAVGTQLALWGIEVFGFIGLVGSIAGLVTAVKTSDVIGNTPTVHKKGGGPTPMPLLDAPPKPKGKKKQGKQEEAEDITFEE